MTSLTKTKIVGTGLPCLFGGFLPYDKELKYMLSAQELVSQLLLYLLLIILYHRAHSILDYFISLLITALHLFLKLYHANYNRFLNSVQRFFAKLNWIKAGIEHNKKELKYYGIKIRLS